MHAPSDNPVPPEETGRRFRFLPRFRTATLLWLVVVVSAFFVGRQSDEIGRRLIQIWSSVWPSSKSYTLVHNRDGSVLFALKWPLKRAMISGNACAVKDIESSTPNLKFTQYTPERDGTTEIEIWQNDGSKVLVELVVKNGKFQSTDEHKIPAANSSIAENRAP